MAADPTAPMNVRTDALEHALNLTNDANFENVNAILSSQQSAIPELLVQTVLDDSYNRETHHPSRHRLPHPLWRILRGAR